MLQRQRQFITQVHRFVDAGLAGLAFWLAHRMRDLGYVTEILQRATHSPLLDLRLAVVGDHSGGSAHSAGARVLRPAADGFAAARFLAAFLGQRLDGGFAGPDFVSIPIAAGARGHPVVWPDQPPAAVDQGGDHSPVGDQRDRPGAIAAPAHPGWERRRTPRKCGASWWNLAQMSLRSRCGGGPEPDDGR